MTFVLVACWDTVPSSFTISAATFALKTSLRIRLLRDMSYSSSTATGIGVSTGGLFIRDARTGDNQSRVRIGGLINHPPVVGGKSVYIVSNGNVRSFDVDSRALPWAYQVRLIWTQLSLWQLPVPTPPDLAGFRWHTTPMEHGPETSIPLAGNAEMMYVGATPWPEFSTPVAGKAEFITAPAATSDAIYRQQQ